MFAGGLKNRLRHRAPDPDSRDDHPDPDDHKTNGEKKPKSRRPPNTAFRQQRLKAWQPILTPRTVLPLFFAIGLIFAPIGGLLLYASAKVQELRIDYSECATRAPLGTSPSDFKQIPTSNIETSFKHSNSSSQPAMWRRSQVTHNFAPGVDVPTTMCSLQFDIPDDLAPPVLMYYRLTEFYQNHRRYVKSLDTNQLKGTAVSYSSMKGSSCTPLTRNNTSKKPYYPCGLIANSLFNDTFMSPVAINPQHSSDQNVTYPMTNKGIAWSTDKELYKQTKYNRDDIQPPPNWLLRYPNGYTEDNDVPDLASSEEFQVWMRTAGLPTFSKLALRNDNQTMVSGTYQLDILDYFPVTIFGGTKSIVLSTRSVMGGKNPFLGIAYLVVGGLCIVLGVVFTAAHLIRPRKLGDHTYLTWNNDQPATAAASGRESRPGTQHA